LPAHAPKSGSPAVSPIPLGVSLPFSSSFLGLPISPPGHGEQKHLFSFAPPPYSSLILFFLERLESPFPCFAIFKGHPGHYPGTTSPGSARCTACFPPVQYPVAICKTSMVFSSPPFTFLVVGARPFRFSSSVSSLFHLFCHGLPLSSFVFPPSPFALLVTRKRTSYSRSGVG